MTDQQRRKRTRFHIKKEVKPVPSNCLKPGDSSVLEALRDATRSRHVKLGATPAMARIFEPSYTLSEYRVHLARLLGLFEPLERAVGHAADPADAVLYLQRSSDLREDLEIMGDTSAHLETMARCPIVPLITKAGLPGYRYVILGSMLGGKIIARQLRASFGTDASLRFYGDESGRSAGLWASFCRELEHTGVDDADAICSTAMAVFDVYAEWLSSPAPPSRGD